MTALKEIGRNPTGMMECRLTEDNILEIPFDKNIYSKSVIGKYQAYQWGNSIKVIGESLIA